MENGKNNSGDCNSGNWNSGDCNSGNWNSGDCNSGNWNSGNWNSGDSNSGDWNSGNCNSGDRNSGDWNSGSWNSGDSNSGDWNSGSWNSGDSNSGDWNSGNCNSGYCNSDTPTVRMFNKDSGKNFGEIEFPNFFRFEMLHWVDESKMTDNEKTSFPSYVTTGGYLKCLSYKQAFKESYLRATQEDRDKVKRLPNFDADIFYEISGIKIDQMPQEVDEMTLEEVCKELGREIKIKE